MDEAMDWVETKNTETTWYQVPVEIKRNIIKLLPFPDKQNMMLVNWECSEICESIPNKLHELGVTEFPSTAKTSLTMKWKNGDGRLIRRMMEYRGLSMRQADCPDYTEEAMRVFCKILRKSKIKTVVIEIPCFEGISNLWDGCMSESSQFAVKHFTIRTNDYSLIEKMLNCAKNSRHEISLLANDHGGIETCIFDLEKVKEAKSIILWSLVSNIQDDQLISLKAQNIRVTSMNITSNAITHIIQEWQNGQRILERLHLSSPLINIEEIVQQIQFCVSWKNLTDVCQLIWREVDEEGYSHAIKGPSVDSPAAIGLINCEGVPTFIFRIIKMTRSMSELLSIRCDGKKGCQNVENRIEQVAH